MTEQKTQLGKELQLFEAGALKLPETANEVYAFVKDVMVERTREIAVQVEMLASRSKGHVVNDEASAAVSRDLILEKKEIEDDIKLVIGLVKAKAFKIHKGVSAAEKLLQEPLDAIVSTEEGKIKAWVRSEQERKTREWVAAQNEIRKENERKIKAAQKKADTLLTGITDLAKQKALIEEQLNNPEITEEETNALDAKLRAVNAQITGKQEALQEKTVAVEDLSRQQAPAQFIETKLAGTGIKTVFVAKVTNPMQLIKAIVDGLVSIGVVEFKPGELKKLANNGGVPSLGTTERPVIPGCTIEEDINISTRRAG